MNTACPRCGAAQPLLKILATLADRSGARCGSCGQGYAIRLREREDGRHVDFDVAIIGTLCTVFVRSASLWLLALLVCLALMTIRRLRLEPRES